MRNPIAPEMRWLYVQARPFLHWNGLSFLCFTAASLLALFQPLLMKWLIDEVLPRRDAMLLVVATVLLFVSYEGRALATSLAGFLTLSSTQCMALRLRMRLLKHLDCLSMEYHEGTSVGTRLYPFREPIEEIAYFGSDLMPSVLRTLVAICFTFAAMLALNPRMTLAILPLIPAFLVARHYFRRKLERDAESVQKERTQVNGFLQEHLAAVVQIQLLRQESHQERGAFRLLAKSVKSQLKLSRTGVLFSASTSLAIASAASAVMGYGGSSVVAGTLTVGGLVAFYSYVTQLFEPLSGAMDIYARALRTLSSIRQVQHAFSLEPSITNRVSAIAVPAACSDLKFQNVTFSHTKQGGFLHIPLLEIPAAQRIGVVGPNGAGKSTFAKLATRLYDVRSGRVTLGGIDVRDLELGTLRALLCYLPQSPALFDDSIARNLQLGNRAASKSELFEIMELVGLGGLLDRLPEGLNARIGPGASRLSGGERQRLVLARTLLQRPRLLILDEATSALDSAAEYAILPKIHRRLPEATLIFLSHRLWTLTWVDRILVFDAGLIVQDGTPDSLNRQDGLYRHLFRRGESSASASARYTG
jgi:ABC-type multidrug transport system fused ATPase/permease subunit